MAESIKFKNFSFNNRGFTLIELIVVIAIIGILSSIVLTNFQNVREKARISEVQLELRQFKVAISMLESDTGLSPKKIDPLPCYQDPEVYLNSCAAGIQCTDGGFPDWKGPYMADVPKDPWGTYYYFDADYTCTDQIGCKGLYSGGVRAIVSFGPNKTENYGPNSDDIVLVLCK